MRTEEEIKKNMASAFRIAKAKMQDPNEVPEANYYSGAWHALAWVLGEDVEI